MKIIKTIIFGVVMTLMYTYYYYYEVEKIREGMEKAEKAKRVFADIKKEDIRKFSLHREKGEIVLEKEGGTWRMTAPVQAEADQKAAEAFAEDLANFDIEGVISENPSGYEDFGLAKPTLTLKFSTPQGEHSLSVGDNNPTGTLVYGKTASTPRVFSFLPADKKKMDKDAHALRDKTILSLERDKIKKLTLESGAMRLETARDPKEKKWEVTHPYRWRADKSMMEELIGAVADSGIKKFVEETPKDYAAFGLDKPLAVFTFLVEEKEGEGRHTLLIGKKTEDPNRVYAKRGESPNVFLLEARIVDKLPKEAEGFRDRKLLELEDGGRIVQLRFSGGESLLVKKGEGENWEMLEPMKTRADIFETSQWAENVAKASVSAFLDGKDKDAPEFGLQSPHVSIEVWEKGKEKSQVLLIGGEAKGGGRYVALDGLPNVFLMSEEVYQGLLSTKVRLRDKRLLHFDTEEITKIEIQRTEGKAVLEKSGETWRLSPGEAKVEGNKVRHLLWDLIDLSFSSVAAEGETDPAPFGLDSPALAITLWKGKAEKTGEIRLGKKVPKKEGAEATDVFYVANNTEKEIYEAKTSLQEDVNKKLKEWTKP